MQHTLTILAERLVIHRIRRTRGCSTLRKAGDGVTLIADDESVAKIQLRNI
jgi:hypothetical protein